MRRVLATGAFAGRLQTPKLYTCTRSFLNVQKRSYQEEVPDNDSTIEEFNFKPKREQNKKPVDNRKKLQEYITQRFTPQASEKVLELLSDKSNWKQIAERIKSELSITSENTNADIIKNVVQILQNRVQSDDPKGVDPLLQNDDFVDISADDLNQVVSETKPVDEFSRLMKENYQDEEGMENIQREAFKRSEFEQDSIMKQFFGDESSSDNKQQSTKKEDYVADTMAKEHSFYTKFSETIAKDGDTFMSNEEGRVTLKKFCKPTLRKWIIDAEGATLGKGYYNLDGDWVAYSRLDEEEKLRATTNLTVPTYTFSVVGVPGDTTRNVKRGFIPPPFRQRIPSDLVGRYRFGITPEMVETVGISDKLKKVLSFAYASDTEIKVSIHVLCFIYFYISLCLLIFFFFFLIVIES